MKERQKSIAQKLSIAWFVAVAASWGLWLIEGNTASAVIALGLLPLSPGPLAPVRRTLLVGIGVCALIYGPLVFAGAIFAAASINGRLHSSIGILLTGIAVYFAIPFILTLPSFSASSIPIISFGPFLACAALSGIAAGSVSGRRSASALLGATALTLLILEAAASSHWITSEQFTDPALRTSLVLFPIAVAMPFFSGALDYNPAAPTLFWVPYLVSLLIGLSVGVFSSPERPINAVVFDESHGRWATTMSSFGPEDFGRGANYTYSLLFDYAKRLTGSSDVYLNELDALPGSDTAFFLKMPTKQISAEFQRKLQSWVHSGGRLIVVADHTDLYDTAQHLNPFLEEFGIQIGIDAVYDSKGMPNIPVTDPSFTALGRLDATGKQHPWQTGASFSNLPFQAVVLATFGPSFSEPGDYSRQNRFGPFMPRLSLPYAPNAAVIAVSKGRGAVIVVADSTPWSNFTIFQEPYHRLFKGILSALEKPAAIQMLGWSSAALGFIAIAVVAFPSSMTSITGFLLLGLTLGFGLSISLPATSKLMDGRDFDLRVMVGPQGKVEFLPQLVGPGERNYARIISSTAKHGFLPVAKSVGDTTFELNDARRWLFLEPLPKSLPKPNKVFEHLRQGGDLTVIFPPDSAANRTVREWISSLDMALTRSSGLAITEDAGIGGQGDFISRRGAALFRDSRAVTVAISSGQLSQLSSERLIQTYTLRPLVFPRKYGVLNIGFSADQFSDDSIGDVWEGIWPSSLGQLRERQMAAALAGDILPGPWPDDATMPSAAISENPNNLSNFVIIEDGVTILKGNVQSGLTSAVPISVSDDPIAWASDLRLRALSFLETSCSTKSQITECEQRMISPDGIEWKMSRVDSAGELVALELLHERQFSGLGATINIIFYSAQ